MPASTDGAARVLRPARPVARPLSGLLEELPQLRPDRPAGATTVTGATLDSRGVQPGDLYAALPGARAHGADFAAAAVAGGAAAVLTDPAGAARCAELPVPVLVADDPRGVLGAASRWVYGAPSADLLVLGVTGTNGKTTTAFLLEAGPARRRPLDRAARHGADPHRRRRAAQRPHHARRRPTCRRCSRSCASAAPTRSRWR